MSILSLIHVALGLMAVAIGFVIVGLRKGDPRHRVLGWSYAGCIVEIFERQPFGELEHLITQKLLDVIKTVAKEELNSENWLRLVARLAGRSYEQTRVTLLEFLDTDIFSLSPENCASFLDPLIESWDIDLATFGMEIVLSRRIASGERRRFEFVETRTDELGTEPGFKEFLNDRSLSRTATTEEIELLRKLRFNGRRPTPLYYYRELQSLRDPLHFREGSDVALHKRRDPGDTEKQEQLDSRNRAIRRWAKNKIDRRKKKHAKSPRDFRV